MCTQYGKLHNGMSKQMHLYLLINFAVSGILYSRFRLNRILSGESKYKNEFSNIRELYNEVIQDCIYNIYHN